MGPMGDRVAKDALFEGFSEVAKALSSGRRAEIVDVLAQGERSVEEVAVEIDQSVANTSHHLRALARAGLLTTRRDGTRIYYALASDRVGDLWSAVRDVAEAHVVGLEKLAGAYLGDREGIETVERDELAARLHRRDLVLLDVRPGAEYRAGHITGARSVPEGQLRPLISGPSEGRGCRRLLPRALLRLRRRRRARADPQGDPSPPPHRRLPRVEACRTPRCRRRRLIMEKRHDDLGAPMTAHLGLVLDCADPEKLSPSSGPPRWAT